VLSYLLLRLLPQWWPWSGCTLCTVHCTSVHSHVGTYRHRSLFLLPSQVTFFASIPQCTLHWLQLCKLLSLPISLRNLQTLCFILSVGSWPELPQHSILNTFVFSLIFCCIVASFSCTVFDPGLPSNPADSFSIRFLPLTLFVHFILCVSYFELQISFLLIPASPYVFLCTVLPYSGFHILLFLGRVPHNSLDRTCIFQTSHYDLWRSDPPCRCGSNYSGQTLPLRWDTFGSASSRPSSQWQGSDPKSLSKPML
jgi:hypothetical protein